MFCTVPTDLQTAFGTCIDPAISRSTHAALCIPALAAVEAVEVVPFIVADVSSRRSMRYMDLRWRRPLRWMDAICGTVAGEGWLSGVWISGRGRVVVKCCRGMIDRSWGSVGGWRCVLAIRSCYRLHWSCIVVCKCLLIRRSLVRDRNCRNCGEHWSNGSRCSRGLGHFRYIHDIALVPGLTGTCLPLLQAQVAELVFTAAVEALLVFLRVCNWTTYGDVVTPSL
jgi:hypothetical protein